MTNTLRVKLAWVLATFFGVGFAPKAPGTFGSFAALPLAWIVWEQQRAIAWGIFFILLGVSVWAADIVVEDSKKEDNQKIVVDEVMGILLTTSVISFSWLGYGLAFLLFRIFDILKPFPASWLDKNWKGGHGAIADDIGAALWSTACIYVIHILGWI
jgi:phosphatidylglycerophosphatase A